MARCLTVALLTTACARSVPRVTPPPDLSTTERSECEELARATEAQVQGASVWSWAAIGALAGSLVGLGALFSANLSGDPAEVGPWAVEMIKQASPFPAPARMGGVKYTEIWLVHKTGRFQLDTLTEGQL